MIRKLIAVLALFVPVAAVAEATPALATIQDCVTGTSGSGAGTEVWVICGGSTPGGSYPLNQVRVGIWCRQAGQPPYPTTTFYGPWVGVNQWSTKVCPLWWEWANGWVYSRR